VPAARNYSTNGFPTTLPSGAASSGSVTVASMPGTWPAPPFSVLLDWGLSTQEAIGVTAVSGSGPFVLTCTRGIDGTTAQSHAVGASAVPGVTAQDFAQPMAFIGTQSWQGLLTRTAVKTSAYTLTPGDYVPVDTTSGAVTITLPHAPADLSVFGVKLIASATPVNAVTVAASGGDVFNKTAGATSETLSTLNQGFIAQYQASSGIWTIYTADLALSQLDARYPQRGGGTATGAVAPLTYLNPKDYGAKFDGTTDDSAALGAVQAANSDVLFPAATAITASTVRFAQSGERIRGSGMYATTVKASGSLSNILAQVASGYASSVTLEDMTIDFAGTATGGISAGGYGIGRLTLRRVRFVNFPAAGLIDGGYASEFLIEDCVAEGGGLAVASFFTGTNKEIDSLIMRRNKIRWMHDGVIIGANNFHAAYVEIDDNNFDMGWMHTKALFSGSSGVTYTSNSLADSGASFSGLVSFQPVRAMPVLRSGNFTTVTGTHCADTGANFTTAGVMRNHIVRSGTSFAVVDAVETTTTLHVREWLDQTTYLPVAPPSNTASYTIYGLLFLNISSSTSTSITGQHGGSGGGGGWYDLTGAESTPASGTRYEVLPLGNYAVFLTSVADKAQITGNRMRGGWSDQIEHFGTRAIITGNIVEDGNNYGIFTGSSTATPTLDKSVISDNIIKHNAFGLGVTGATDVEIGPNQYEDNGWGVPNGNIPVNGVRIFDSARVTVTGGNATNTSECASTTAGIYLLGANTSDCKIQGFRGSGHALADIYIDSTVPAGTCELINVSGTISYAGTTNGQRVQVKGTGAPSLPASPGSLFLRTDGSTSTTLYVKETGNGSSGWNPFGSTLPYGQRAAYSSSTSGSMSANTSGSTLTTMVAISSSPSITLPNDGHTYRISLSAPAMQPASQTPTAIGVGTAASAILKYTFAGFSGELEAPCFVQTDVVASGQTISCYAYSAGGVTVTLGAASNAPAELSAVLVAS
jgi:hypothetical protein